jgi:hypothetical protein
VKAVIGSLTILLSLFSLSATAKLTPLQIHSIQNGWHAPYSEETIKQAVGLPKYQPPKLKYDIPLYVPQSYWEEPVDKWMWVFFWTLQLADIYSTQQGLKYDCIKEANPLLPEVPTIAEMATLKSVVLLPSYGAIGYENITRGELIAPLLLGGFVVHNNLKLTRKAEKRCNLR